MIKDDLLKRLEETFGDKPKPATLLDMSDESRRRYASEVAALEAMDWENGTPQDLGAFYEPNTFLSVSGFKYLIPRVFAFCKKWPNTNKDVIGVMKSMPFLGDTDAFVESFVGEERRLLWLFLEETHKMTGMISLKTSEKRPNRSKPSSLDHKAAIRAQRSISHFGLNSDIYCAF
ncbi:MAG: hypothetical protein AAF227_05160 [Pseudomonadota bacterium]